MLLQLGGIARFACHLQVARRRIEVGRQPRQQTRDQRRTGLLAHANGDVEGLGHEVHIAWAEVQVECDARIAARELRDQRCHVDGREVHRQRRTQHAGGLGQHLSQLLVRDARFFDDASATLVVDLPCFGQLDPARRAMQQAQADHLFQRPDAARQGRVGHPRHVGRPSKALGFHDLHEEGHVVQVFRAHCANFGPINLMKPSLSHGWIN
ncbi:hypothetical protein D3C86_1508910 [compost metagenome]